MQALNKGLVLIVDDEPRNRKLLSALVRSEGHDFIEAGDGETALVMVQDRAPDLILLDIMMPGMDGLEVTRRIKQHHISQHIPIILITSLSDKETRVSGLEAGAEEFLTKPVDRVELSARLRNLLRLKQYSDQIRSHNAHLEEEVTRRTNEVLESRIEIVRALGRAAEYRDNETGLHTLRMSKYAQLVAAAMGLEKQRCDMLLIASPMHDIGKVGIPDEVLLKPGKLNDEEWAIMREHTRIGARILAGGDADLLKMAESVALYHHERWDGSGYPEGLSGEAIPLEARIVAIADVFDALTSKRPYKRAWSAEEAIEEIRRMKGSHFQPEVVEAFEASLDDILGVLRLFGDDTQFNDEDLIFAGETLLE